MVDMLFKVFLVLLNLNEKSTTLFPQRSLLSFCRHPILFLRIKKLSRKQTSQFLSSKWNFEYRTPWKAKFFEIAELLNNNKSMLVSFASKLQTKLFKNSVTRHIPFCFSLTDKTEKINQRPRFSSYWND